MATVDFGSEQPGLGAEPKALTFETWPPSVSTPAEPTPKKAAQPEPEPPPPPAPPPMPPVVEVPEEILQALYEQVVLQGLEEGKTQVLSELTVLQTRYAHAIEQLEAVSRQLIDRNRVNVITLACRVAERLVKDHLKLHPGDMLRLVRDVLDDLGEEARDGVVIECGPDDHEFLAEHRATLGDRASGAFHVQIAENPELEFGEFRVETRAGSANGGLIARLAAAREALLGGTPGFGDG